MFSYKVKDLYIGVLGFVVEKRPGHLSIEKRNTVIIYQKVKCGDYDYCAKEIFTNQKYYFFQGNFSNYDTIYKSINNLAIYSSTPLSTIISQKKITQKELKEIYNGINENLNPKPKEKVEEASLPVTDSILQMILETSKKVKNANIDEYLKEKTLQDLKNLSEYYVNEIINKLDNKELELTIENEYTIKMNSIKRLVEIEENYQNPSQAQKYSLQKQLVQVKKDLK